MLSRCLSAPSLKIDAKTREQFVQYGLTDETIQTDLALIIGDAVHNLKCALDFTWCGVLKVIYPSSLHDKSKFPVFEDRKRLESALTKSGKNKPHLHSL